MSRQVIVGATQQQLADLDRLFPHQGPSMVAGDSNRHLPHDSRQIRVGAYPQIVGAYPQIVGYTDRHQSRQIVGANPGLELVAGDWARHERRQIVGDFGGERHDRHERRQIVGAYVEEAVSQGKFKELGLPLTAVAGVSIAAGATQDFELKPNRLFLPGPLALPSAIAPNLIMYGLNIGGENCLLSTGAIPCDAFNNLTVHKPFKAWTASNAQPITFTLKNIHASAAQVVFGVWWGLAEV
jgi:hypothetical protein